MTDLNKSMPDENGYFGEYGGQLLPPELIEIMNQISDAYDKKMAKTMSADETILVNLSGRGDKDADFVAEYLSL